MAKNRSGIAFIIAIVVLILLYFTVPAPVSQPRGLFLPGLTYHPYPVKKASDVQWLVYPPAWGSYPQLGSVSFEFKDASGSAEKRQEIMNAMKAAAAKAGGNAVVKQQLFNTGDYTGPSQARWVGRGVVILVPKAP
jgi:hypothetical protein